MFRTLLVVVALGAAAYAAPNYAFNQIDELVGRISVCLKPVPQGGFSNPATDCMYKARDNLRSVYAKETQAAFIASCLLNYRNPVKASIVATAKKCLTESLAKPVKPALKKVTYSTKQQQEIGSRIKACQSSIVEPKGSSPAADCRNDALIEAQKGYPKESLADFIAPCLTGKKIAAKLVAQAKTCIVASLAKPLSTR
ncbi:uncharacterized protein LOC117653469 [Thrips palmi]|uniref:Uncharacterized protein LOC117653469 n=1 Tax=Thrips palmi TaxID=161013 RepID=A0A6P9AHT8_THRPL|nr:uncharacterized protein LOC117653469 [Thrips palmi]